MPRLVDVLLAAAWALLAADNARQERRARATPDAYGTVVAGWRRVPALLRVLYVAGTAAGVVLVERRTGRWAGHPAATAAGLLLAAGGAALHLRARHALGALWSDVIAVRARHRVVEDGPYAVVRHPIYLAVLLLALGTLLAHPSPATTCVALGVGAGVALKIPLEERVLRRTLGDTYARYAGRVPGLVPRPFRRGRP